MAHSAEIKRKFEKLAMQSTPANVIAQKLKLSLPTVKRWLRESNYTGRPTLVQPASSPPVGTVTDEDPSELFDRPGSVDRESFETATGAGSIDSDGERTAGDVPPAPPPPVSPEDVVNMVDAALHVGCQVAARMKKVAWTPELEAASRLSEAERSELRATAPFVVPMLASTIGRTPELGAGLFALSLVSVVLSRASSLSAAGGKRSSFGTRATHDVREEPTPVPFAIVKAEPAPGGEAPIDPPAVPSSVASALEASQS